MVDLGRNRWWSEGWLALLAEMDPTYGGSHASGWGGSRRNRVQRLEVLPGQIRAQVRDREAGLCQVQIGVSRFTPAQWRQVIDAMADQAIFAAQLLAGDLPVEIEPLFAQAGVSLLPRTGSDLTIGCSHCGGPGPQAAPCPHAVQVLGQMGGMLGDDPWLIFQLRGMERSEILQALRERRLSRRDQESLQPSPPVSLVGPEGHPFFRLNPEPESLRWPGPDVRPLAEEGERFWGDLQQLEALQHSVGRPIIDLTLLRRLGYPPFPSQSVESYNALAHIYRQVTEQALALAFGEEQGSGSPEV